MAGTDLGAAMARKIIVVPLAGGVVAAALHRVLYPEPPVEPLASGEMPV